MPSVSFTGGEPTLRPELPELVRFAKQLGMRVNLITNGTLMTEELATRLAEAGLDSAQVSLEGVTAQTHEKITKARHFNQGFATTEYLAASLLDLKWHTTGKIDPKLDVREFENEFLDRIGLIPEIIPRYRSPYFRHIFAGGYSSGYYSYVWAAVLDADAFEAFKETGDIFDAKTAKAFRENILSKGGTEDPKDLFQKFRGKQPSIEPLLKRKGLK